jgi:hypothetical protein
MQRGLFTITGRYRIFLSAHSPHHPDCFAGISINEHRKFATAG